VVYPVPKKFTNSLFGFGKRVYLKYTTHEVISKNLQECKKLIFYESRGNKKLIGEGNIEKIELLSLDEVLKKYKGNIFLNEEQLNSYSNGRTKKPVVFTLKKLIKYEDGIRIDIPITMGGKYITKSEYHNILDKGGE